MAVNLPTTLLRSFVAIVDTGSMLSAAEQVFVTQSALSLQIKRLEELVQQPLFAREGRRLALTTRGEVLLGYARRVLALHDEAISAMSTGNFAGPVRIGMVQDFAETLFTGVLGRFAGLHPEAQVYARVAGTAELHQLLERGQLDIILGYAAAEDEGAVRVSPMLWHGNDDLAHHDVLPLACLEKPCRFREAAIASLQSAGRRYRMAVETPNLSTLRAAVDAGLGVTCRTPLFRADLGVVFAGELPPLPKVACIVGTADGLSPSAQRLADLTLEVLQAL